MRSPVDSSTWGAWKTIAFHGDNISNFNNDSGYITSSGSCSYATSAGSAPADGGTADYIWCKDSGPDSAYVGGKLSSFYSWNKGGTTSGYSIGITVGGHPSDPNYGWQLAQSLWNDDLYYRRYDNSGLGGWGSWYKVLNPTNGLSREPWWNESDSHSVNDLGAGITFAYQAHGAPTTGTLISFAGIGGGCEAYRLQVQGNYYGNSLYFRNRNGDNSTWGDWREIIHSGNIGSQSVNYASSSGNADTVDNEHASAFAHRETDENLIAHGNEFNFVPSGYGTVEAHSSTDVYFNFRTAGGMNGNITSYILGNGAGGSLGTIIHTGNILQYASKVEIVDLR